MWFLRICALIGLGMLWVGAWWLGSVVVEWWLRSR
jgi:hypothetical protein